MGVTLTACAMQCRPSSTFIVKKCRSGHLRDTCRHLTANHINHLLNFALNYPMLNLWVTNLRVSFQSWMDCAIKSTSVTFIRAAATLIQTRHICQICALWKFLSGFSIFCNYVQSDAIKSHSFPFSDPISVLQHESAKSVFQFSGPIFGNFWQQKEVEWGRDLCRIRVTGLHFE